MKKTDSRDSIFRTPVPVCDFGFSLAYTMPMMAIGSCFAAHIGNRLNQAKFSIHVNPFGILFNPLSMAQGLDRLWRGAAFTQEELFVRDGQWISFAHHGKFSGADPVEVLDGINQAFRMGAEHLRQAQCLILTLGTAFVWERQDSGEIVANCHKMPSSFFRRRRATLEEIIQALDQTLSQILMEKPATQILLTVSPIRHLRDGLLENQRSKATLLLAVDTLAQKYAQVHYFPAYELLLDDLRDYRFYAADMAHPSEIALEYIWSYFCDCFLTTEEKQRIEAVEHIHQAMQHRPFNPSSMEHKIFKSKQLDRILLLEKRWPLLDFSKEKAYFSSLPTSN